MEIPPSAYNPLDTGPKMNVHKTFRRRPGRLLNVLCTFNLHSLSRGKFPQEEISNPQESHSGTQLPNLRQPTILFKHFIFCTEDFARLTQHISFSKRLWGLLNFSNLACDSYEWR